MILRATALAALVLLGACAQRPQPVQPPLAPLPPASLGRSLVATQKVSGGYGDSHHAMLVQLEVDPERLAMAGSTPTGQVLFSLELQGRELHSEVAPFLPASLHPAWVLADFQLTFWPVAVVQQALEAGGAGYRLQESPDGLERQLLQGHEVVADIHYGSPDHWSQAVEFTHRRWHYHYTIETLSIDAP